EKQIEAALWKLNRRSPALQMLAQFLLATGTRISEALSISLDDLTPLGAIKIKTLKHGKPRIINAGICTAYLLDCKKKKYLVWNDWNRFFVYHEFKKAGFYIQTHKSKRVSVTHAGRHIVAQTMQRAGMSQEDTMLFLGHKTTKANEHYYNKNK
ncbi:MAG: Phage integrase family, partial [Cyanobacteriota bacterium]